MDVPIEAGAGAEGGVDVWEQPGGEGGGEVSADEVVG